MRHDIRGETIADILTGKPIPLVLYEDDHATDWHTHDVDASGSHVFRYPAHALSHAEAVAIATDPVKRLQHALDQLHPSARYVRVEVADLEAVLPARPSRPGSDG